MANPPKGTMVPSHRGADQGLRFWPLLVCSVDHDTQYRIQITVREIPPIIVFMPHVHRTDTIRTRAHDITDNEPSDVAEQTAILIDTGGVSLITTTM
jgi:hypothetical protein